MTVTKNFKGCTNIDKHRRTDTQTYAHTHTHTHLHVSVVVLYAALAGVAVPGGSHSKATGIAHHAGGGGDACDDGGEVLLMPMMVLLLLHKPWRTSTNSRCRLPRT